MGNTAWKCGLVASILAGALWAAGSSKAEEKASPTSFNSHMAFDVYTLVGEGRHFVGSTPSERPLTIPAGKWWYVEPRHTVDMEKVRQEVEAQRIPGLRLGDATDADLEHLKGLKELHLLYLIGGKVTDAGLEHLKGLTGLQRLDLLWTKTTDAGLEHLRALTKLQYLNLYATQVTDAGLEQVEVLTASQNLELGRTHVTDAGLGKLQGLTGLKKLSLYGTQVTDAGLEHLKGLTALQELNLVGTRVTDAGVARLKKSLPNVVVVW